MNFRRLNQIDLADFAANLAVLLAGTELTAIEANVRAAILAAMGTLPDQLADATAEAAVAEDTKRAAVSRRNAINEAIDAIVVQVREQLKAGTAPKQQFDLCGFDYPFTRPSRYIAGDPTDLSVSGLSIGLNTGVFNGNNIAGRVTYEIWRRLSKTGDWTIVGTTRKQKFTDTPVKPGQFYEYKVRAVAARSVSHFSNPAVIYGVM
jgi:hypothetical protein